MKEQKEEYYSLSNIADFSISFLRYLLSKWLLLLLFSFIGLALGVGYYFRQEPKYEAVTTFILEEKGAGGGGLAGLASQFGLDIGGLSGGGNLFAGDNILDILKSGVIIKSVLLSKVDSNIENSKITLADLFLDFSGWKMNWSADESLKDLSFGDADSRSNLSLKQDSVLNLIQDYILKESLSAERLNKKGTIIKVQVSSSNSLFAILMTNRLVEEASKLYLNIKTGNAQANISRMQRRSDSLLLLLNNKSYSVAAAQVIDANPGFRTAVVPIEIAARDKTVIATLYAEITKNLEASKMILSQQTPVLQVLDSAHLPLENKSKKVIWLSLVGLITGMALCSVIVGIKYILVVSRSATV